MEDYHVFIFAAAPASIRCRGRTPTVEPQKFLLSLTQSEGATRDGLPTRPSDRFRRISGFFKKPEYPLSILRNMFQESAAYPRASVGNNLSDAARQRPGLVHALVEELAASGDIHSYWTA